MGRVIGAFGVRGWCKVLPLSADPSSLVEYRQWWLRSGAAADWKPIAVEDAKVHGSAVVVKLPSIATRDDALALRGTEIAIPQQVLPRRENEYYFSELVGFSVRNRAGEALGEVAEITDNGAHAIMRVHHDARDRLIPWVESYVDRVDREDRRIDVDWPSDY